ncbi:MAG TPA: ATP synthase F1 subunit gamma, partial [Alphaproteobacteria bacterium]|nr:ATP synthase F1 subunit gamma [Alphaproteobacteria bacterium]
QPYAQAMAEMLARVAGNVVINASSSRLLVGTGSDQRHLIVAVTADRGLCGGFNATLVKVVREKVRTLQAEGKDVFVVCVGRKGRDLLKRSMGQRLWQSFTGITGKNRVDFVEANKVTQYILEKFNAGEFDVCTLAYNKFENVLSQPAVTQQIIPFDLPETTVATKSVDVGPKSPYSFEPEEEAILNALLPKNLGVQVYRALLDSSAGEQAARMTAMDNATRNAGDMIKAITLQYNRARQAYITKELIEIISGAEAV